MEESFIVSSEEKLKNDLPGLEHLDGDFIYEAVKLNKQMGKRFLNKKKIEGVDSVDGLEIIKPTQPEQNSFLHRMVKSEISQCDFLIVVAMYNEGPEEFMNTLTGVCDNLQNFSNHERIACIVIVDGIGPFLDAYFEKTKTEKASKNKAPINDKALTRFFSQFFSIELVRRKFNPANRDIKNCRFKGQKESDEFAHCFIHKVKLKPEDKPLNLVFCVKHFNKRKLNTHLWFFGGFCEMIQPKFVMLLDVGTKPLALSLNYLYDALNNDENLAGCCGEIIPMKSKFTDIVISAQITEYKFSHIFDKALESIIGYITVLPGAFSAYRWKALNGSPLWDDYFKSICHPELMDTFQSNIYLAEDRVLCLSLFTKKGHNYILRYVRNSKAETDAPGDLIKLMDQRRRWINGSWFALIDSIQKCNRMSHSNHNKCRACAFYLQMIYFVLNVIFAWFNVGIYCLSFFILIYEIFPESHFEQVRTILISIYVIMLIIVLLTSLGGKPNSFRKLYIVIATIMGIYQVVIFILALILLVKILTSDYPYQILSSPEGYQGFAMVISVILFVLTVCFAVVIVINNQCSIFKQVIQYIILVPTYMNIFFIYAICNVNDCTWGNRPDKLTSEELERVEEFKEFRARWVIIWVLCNATSGYLPLVAYKADRESTLLGILIIGAPGILLLAFKVIGGILHRVSEAMNKKKKMNSTSKLSKGELAGLSNDISCLERL